MAHRIEILGSLSQDQLLELYAYCHDRFGDELELRPVPRVFGVDVETIGMLSGVVAAITSIISLCLQLRQSTPGSVWSLARLKDEVATECARLGLSDVQITSIINFNALLEASQEPCKLRLVSVTKDVVLDMYVFNDGTKYTIQTR